MNIDWVGKSEGLALQVRDFVGGRWTEGSGQLLEKYAPRDGQLLYRFVGGSVDGVNAAVTESRRAFQDGRWSKAPVARRKEALHRLASLVEANAEELALLECLDVGKPINDALNFDIPAVAAILRHAADAVDYVYGDVYAADQSSLSYELRRPLGVVAGIVGWNFPLALAAQKIGPALASGNSLVLKPSEITSLSTARLAELAVQAGVPEGVFNVIHGDAQVGAALGSHNGVDLVTFTGSTRTGKKLLIAAGQSNMKRLLLECGGKAPNIVFDDCPDLDSVADAVADAVAARAFWNQGQVCTASSRLLIQETIKDELLRLIVRKADSMVPGDPLKADTRFGALVSREHREKVLDCINNGEQEGARMVFRSNSQPPVQGGSYLGPVIFDQVSSNQKLAQDEIFGPVLSVISFRHEEDAIEIANNTIYGLSAILWTKDVGRAHRATQGIRAGSLTVNANARPAGGPGPGALPVGGHKESGMGVEGGVEGLKMYTSHSAVQIFV